MIKSPRPPLPLLMSTMLLMSSCEPELARADCAPGYVLEGQGGCIPATDEGDTAGVPEPTIDHRLPLDATRLLRRMSLDLRGILPSEAELDTVAADPTAISELRAAWLQSTAFEERLVVLLGEHWLTLVDDVVIQTGEAGLEEQEQYHYVRSVGEEPLRLMARVAIEGRPWSEIVTADWTMSNPMLSGLWPLDYSPDKTGWQPAHYTDGRPAAGVLSTNGMWWRYVTNRSNSNRGRAAAISRLLLCYDYLTRPVSFQGSVSISVNADVDEAARNDPICLTCHSTLDPLAATLFSFWWFEEHHVPEMASYHPERELLGASILGVSPAWYGRPVASLAQVGSMLASDSRFPACTTKTMAKLLWRREVVPEDHSTVATLTSKFINKDLLLTKLIVDLTDTPSYQVGSISEEAPEGFQSPENIHRILTAEQLATVIEDLTGFSWTWQGTAMLRNDTVGYRLLGGGIDGRFARTIQTEPGLTWALVNQRVAEAAAVWVANSDLTAAESPLLLDRVTAEDRPGDAAFTAQLEALVWRLFAREISDDEQTALEDLWTDANNEVDVTSAWAEVVAVLLRDPDFLMY